MHVEINKWKLKSEEIVLKKKQIWSAFFAKKIEKQPADTQPILVGSSIENTHHDKSTPHIVPTENALQQSAASSIEDTQQDKSTPNIVPSIVNRSFQAPRQEQIKLEIATLNSEIVFLMNKKSSGLASDLDDNRLMQLKSDLRDKENTLKTKINCQARQQRKREHDRGVLAEIRMNHPDVAAKFVAKKSKIGRPRSEENQPELLNAILHIAWILLHTDVVLTRNEGQT